jgi:ABC-type transport system involved in cytochrome c biogenesis permease subunit
VTGPYNPPVVTMLAGSGLTNALLGVLALICYAVATYLYVAYLRHPHLSEGRLASVLAILGALLNLGFLYARSVTLKSVPYSDLLGSMALFGFFLATMNCVLEFRHRDRSLGPFLMPVALLFLLLAFVLPGGGIVRPNLKGAIFAFHVTLNMLSYAAFAVACALSLIYLVLVRQLKSRSKKILKGAVSRFPSLGYLERANRTSIAVGVVSLGVGLTLGFTWAYRVWRGVHPVLEIFLDAKILAALLTLGFYLFVYLRARLGAAPVTTARLSVAGFFIVLLSYTAVNLFFSRVHVFT